MALQSFGYDGTVSELAWAQMSPQLGTEWAVDKIPGGYAASVGSEPYSINLAPGVATSHGVMVRNTSTYVAKCPPITSGTRWDTVCIYRDWRPNSELLADGTRTPGGNSSIVVLPGTATKAIAPGLKSNPGVEEHQPLHLAFLDAKKTQVTLVDLRPWAQQTLQVETELAIPNPVRGQIAGIDGVPSVYRTAPNRWDQIGKNIFHRAWGRDVSGIKYGPVVLASYKVPDPGFPYRLVCSGAVTLGLPPKTFVKAEVVAGNDIVSTTQLQPTYEPNSTNPADSLLQQYPLVAGFNDLNLTGSVTVGIRVSSAFGAPVGYWRAAAGGTVLNIQVVPA